MVIKEFLESTSEPTILKRILDDIHEYRKKNKGRDPHEIQVNAKGYRDLADCNFFYQDFYRGPVYAYQGDFVILGVKCVVRLNNEDDYKVITD